MDTLKWKFSIEKGEHPRITFALYSACIYDSKPQALFQAHKVLKKRGLRPNAVYLNTKQCRKE